MAHDSAANGTLTPPTTAAQSPTPSITSAKRKRSESDFKALSNGVSAGDSLRRPRAQPRSTVQQTLTAVLDVLQDVDTEPSILELPLSTASSSSPADPATKKVKLSSPAANGSIIAKVKSSAYDTLDEFSRDVEAATSQVTEPLMSRDSVQLPGSYARTNPLSLAETHLLTGALALQKMARKLLEHERSLYESHRAGGDDASEDKEPKEEASANANVIEIKLERGGSDTNVSAGARNVLTLFGTAQGPKQLFSSLQKPSAVLGKRPASALGADVNVALPIREELLPNMISTTKLLSVEYEDSDTKKGSPTIGELFRESAGARTLSPPKPKQTTSRGTTITWEFPDTKPKRRGSYNYTTTASSVGQWLGYRGVDVMQEPTSPEAKRKQRDRALSTGEARPQMSEEARAALEQAKLDALFRSVYSSFAPSRDDAAAIFPAETKDMVWWHRIGERKFEEQFAVDDSVIDPDLMDTETNQSGSMQNGDSEAELKEAIDDYVPDEPISLEAAKDDTSSNSKDTDDILREISELLETLDSYQRIRNSSLATNSHARTPSMSSQRETMTNMSGTPSTPTSAEVEVYNLLKTQLTIMINQLPPFAVAKLNGEQLADLNITKSILYETPDYKGVMEEDQFSRLARAAALNAAMGHPAGRMAQGPTGNQFTPSGSGYGRNIGNVRSMSQNYFPQQQPPNRTPSMPISRSGQFSTPQSYHGSGAARPSHQQQQGFSQSSMRSQGYGSTPMSGHQQFFSQQQSKQSNFPQYYPNSPQSQSQSRNFGQQSANQSYQPRPPSAGPGQQAPMYGYSQSPKGSSGSPHPRTASPQKIALPQQTQPRPIRQGGNSNLGTPNSVSTPNIGPQPRSGGGSSSGGAQFGNGTPSGLGPSGFHTSMSNAEQQSLMERQRAQIQAQQQKQQQQQMQGGGGGGSASPPSGAAVGA